MKASAIFHRLLRVVDRYITKRNANPLWRNYVLDQFHQNRNLADPKKIQKLFAIALEYSDLVQSVHENKVTMHFELLFGWDDSEIVGIVRYYNGQGCETKKAD